MKHFWQLCDVVRKALIAVQLLELKCLSVGSLKKWFLKNKYRKCVECELTKSSTPKCSVIFFFSKIYLDEIYCQCNGEHGIAWNLSSKKSVHTNTHGRVYMIKTTLIIFFWRKMILLFFSVPCVSWWIIIATCYILSCVEKFNVGGVGSCDGRGVLMLLWRSLVVAAAPDGRREGGCLQFVSFLREGFAVTSPGQCCPLLAAWPNCCWWC